MIEDLKNRFDFWTFAMIFLFMVVSLLCLAEWFRGEKDGPFEEIAEDMIEHHTGIDIDLSPGYYE